MRHGGKSKRQCFDGYKLHAAATGGEAPLVTAVAVEAASEPDGPRAKKLVDSQPEAQRPKRVLGDTAYGNQDVREQMQERQIAVLAPPATSGTHPVFSKEQFEIDLAAGTVTCPAGKLAAIGAPDRKGQRTAHFRSSDCRACPLKPRCTQSEQRNVTLVRREDLLIAARQSLDDPDTAEHLRRTRPRIERLLALLALLAHRYGARKSRYRGKTQGPPSGRLDRGARQPQPDRARPHGHTCLNPNSPNQPPHRTIVRNPPRPIQRTGFSEVS